MGKTQAGGIFVVRKDRKLLICHPTNHKADFWSIPKGKADDGESMLDCALRETLEESNLDLKDSKNFTIHMLPSINYGHKKKMLHPFLFLETPTSDIDWSKADIKCNSNVPLERGGFPEMDDFLFTTLDEAEKLLHETQVACIPKIREIVFSENYFMV